MRDVEVLEQAREALRHVYDPELGNGRQRSSRWPGERRALVEPARGLATRARTRSWWVDRSAVADHDGGSPVKQDPPPRPLALSWRRPRTGTAEPQGRCPARAESRRNSRRILEDEGEALEEGPHSGFDDALGGGVGSTEGGALSAQRELRAALAQRGNLKVTLETRDRTGRRIGLPAQQDHKGVGADPDRTSGAAHGRRRQLERA